tara:strand:- start:48 stop:524 length:477 start_codon:yes stop_codon:yes gene_type:complete
MKIEIKYNIDFGKAVAELEEKKLNESANTHLSTNLADTLKTFIKKKNNGLEPLSPTQKNVRLFKYNSNDTRPLYLTGKLHNSLQGSNQGLKGVSYINKGAENHADGYTWSTPHPDKQMDNPKVPSRNIMMGYTQNERSKNNEEFGKKIVKLINETIRK